MSNLAAIRVGPRAEPEALRSVEGWFHPETRVCETENHELPTMLRRVFDQMQNGLN